MADLCLSRTEAEGQLPAVCMQCGKPAPTTRRMWLTTSRLTPASHFQRNETGLLLALLDFLPWLASRRFVLRAPLCRWHRWIVPPSFQLVQLTPDMLRLTGVAEDFLQALQRQRQPRA